MCQGHTNREPRLDGSSGLPWRRIFELHEAYERGKGRAFQANGIACAKDHRQKESGPLKELWLKVSDGREM